MTSETITLEELNKRIGYAIISDPSTQQVWVTAELSDVSCRNGHTYMELIQKDGSGNQVAKARGMIWRSRNYEISNFENITGQKFCSGIKLKVLASATMHPLFGLSLTITEIDATFTIGDLLLKRREIVAQLTKDGVINDNKNLTWNIPSLRIAVISAKAAAGYGDFMNHLHTNGLKYRFTASLFPAMMQGEQAVPTILKALNDIEDHIEQWDGVVIIRGGGATSDFAAFENYELAHRIATFPLPVIVGIGHERDITVLDYVANIRVKNPTAAADWLVSCCDRQLEMLLNYSRNLKQAVTEKVSIEKMQLSYYHSNLSNFPFSAINHNNDNLMRRSVKLESVCLRNLMPHKNKLQLISRTLSHTIENIITIQQHSLHNKGTVIEALSPISVLKRGFSITTCNGRTLKSAHLPVTEDSIIKTILYDGEIISRPIKQ